MQIPAEIQCPCCGEWFELLVDTTIPTQRFVTDCEVCCRPFEVRVECQPGEVVNVETAGN